MTSKSAKKSYTRACPTTQGQKESELLTRITSAGACAHIITYYNFEAAPDGRMFLAMELADQGTLRRRPRCLSALPFAVPIGKEYSI